MQKNEIFNIDFLPIRQKKLFFYNQYFKLFIKLYKNNLLPNKILLTGQSGLGKATFAYHFIKEKIISSSPSYNENFFNIFLPQLAILTGNFGIQKLKRL